MNLKEPITFTEEENELFKKKIKNNTIVIVPAKKDSKRIKNKNMLEINGECLPLWAAEYAYDEGLRNIIISTNNPELVKKLEHLRMLKFFDEKVDDRNMINCMKQVVEGQKQKKKFVILLQPTSPIRRPGLLKRMLIDAYNQEDWVCSMSCHNFKMIGYDGEKFNYAYRDQDKSTRWFSHFDGNILIVDRKFMLGEERLFDDGISCYPQPFPYYLQIDEQPEFDVIKEILWKGIGLGKEYIRV